MNIHEQPDSKVNSNGIRNTIKGEAYWQGHVERCARSGLNKAEYARKHELNYARFLYWHRRHKGSTDTQTQNKLLPIKLKQVAYVQLFYSRAKAMKRERAIKKLSHMQKLNLINSQTKYK